MYPWYGTSYCSRSWRSQDRSAIKYHGLINQGSTCYLNSVLQVLYMTKDFREAVESHCRENPRTSNIDLQLNTLFDGLKTCEEETRDVTNRLGISNVYEQRDAAEYYEKILRMTSPEASQVFHGTLTHRTMCCACNTAADADGPFWSLHLAMPDPYSVYHVREGFETFFRPASVHGDNQMYCEVCEIKADATIRCKIKEQPEVLMLLLKRFDLDYQYMTHVKINSCVKIPDTLQTPQKQAYELYAIVDHWGDLRGGHYASRIKSLDGDDQGRWYQFDDSSVTEVDLPQFQREIESSRSAYLLFYRKKHMHSPDTSAQETSRPTDQSSEEEQLPISDNTEIDDENLKERKRQEAYKEEGGSDVAGASAEVHEGVKKKAREAEREVNRNLAEVDQDTGRTSGQEEATARQMASVGNRAESTNKGGILTLHDLCKDAGSQRPDVGLQTTGMVPEPRAHKVKEVDVLVKEIKAHEPQNTIEESSQPFRHSQGVLTNTEYNKDMMQGDAKHHVREAPDKVGGVDGMSIVRQAREPPHVYKPEEGEQRRTQGETERTSGESTMGGEQTAPETPSQVSVVDTAEGSRTQADDYTGIRNQEEQHQEEKQRKTQADKGRTFRDSTMGGEQSRPERPTQGSVVKTGKRQEESNKLFLNTECENNPNAREVESEVNRNLEEADQDTGRTSGQEEASVRQMASVVNSRAESTNKGGMWTQHDLCKDAHNVKEGEVSATETKTHKPQNTIEENSQPLRHSQGVLTNKEYNKDMIQGDAKHGKVVLDKVSTHNQDDTEITIKRYVIVKALPEASDSGQVRFRSGSGQVQMLGVNCEESPVGKSYSTESSENISQGISSLSLEDHAVKGSEASTQSVKHEVKPETPNEMQRAEERDQIGSLVNPQQLHGSKSDEAKQDILYPGQMERQDIPHTLLTGQCDVREAPDKVGGVDGMGIVRQVREPSHVYKPEEGEQSRTQGETERTSGESTMGGEQTPSHVSVVETGEGSRAEADDYTGIRNQEGQPEQLASHNTDVNEVMERCDDVKYGRGTSGQGPKKRENNIGNKRHHEEDGETLESNTEAQMKDKKKNKTSWFLSCIPLNKKKRKEEKLKEKKIKKNSRYSEKKQKFK